MPPSSAIRPMTSPHQFAPRCRAKRRASVWGKEGNRCAAMYRKACFPARNGVRQYMRAGRPYCLSHGGNVAAGRHAKTRGQRRHTVARYARPTPLRRAFSLFFFASSKNGNAALKGLVAPNRHIPRRGGNIAAATVCGASPHKTGTWACLLLAGAAKFCGSPARFNSLGRMFAGGRGS